MNLPEIDQKLQELGITLDQNKLHKNQEITELTDVTDIEGLYKMSIATIKNTKNDTTSKQLIWSQQLKVVTVPIIINNAGIDYFLLVSQSRFAFSGKVSIEVNKGFISEGAQVEDKLLWSYLLNRKLPFLNYFADITNVIELGSYWQHTDMCTFKIPFQLVIMKTKENFDIDELKQGLKVKHDYFNEPKFGPPLHNTAPVLKSYNEILQRLDDILDQPQKTLEEFYINDLFSITALSLSINYLRDKK